VKRDVLCLLKAVGIGIHAASNIGIGCGPRVVHLSGVAASAPGDGDLVVSVGDVCLQLC
jgi:hypothetical protein